MATLTEVLDKKVLVVGAGGIGCELLKNLVLTGFSNIEVVDLDTIDVSNLNRQFLFQRQHVGKSKAEVASESVRKLNPQAKITHFHASIINPDFGVSRFKEYAVVMNALDNRTARIHVNRMCLAAGVPLVESGSSGYLGQVSVIRKGQSECYECLPKAAEKTYPGCTIRNTPSEPIHCIVWAKHVFNQFFGEADIDEDVSPDMSDPELQQPDTNGKGDGNGVSNGNDVAPAAPRVSTRKWAESVKHDPVSLFNKLFRDDIQYLLSMENLWKKRRPPTPLHFETVPVEAPMQSNARTEMGALKEKQVPSPLQSRDIFVSSVESLRKRLEDDPEKNLIWDKDDPPAMAFVAACANLRSFIFGISLKSPFDIKSMAGNIVPAIATTNAIVAGLIVMEAIKVLKGQNDKLRSSFLVRKANPRGKTIVDMIPDPPNPKCYVCSGGDSVRVQLNAAHFTVKMLEEKVLKQGLGMMAPDVNIVSSGSVLISSEEGETAEISSKTLKAVGVTEGCLLGCDDFLQELELRLEIVHKDELKPEEFEIKRGDE